MKNSRQKLIVVLGMHRSGTSVMSRALKVLGVELGDHLIPPISDDNDKGFWEDIDINDFDNALLEKLGSAWDHLSFLNEEELCEKLEAEREEAVSLLAGKMETTELFGFKDPRVAILLPFWQTVFQALELDDVYIVAVRNPLNVANSLLKRDGIPLEAGVFLWAKYMSGVFRHTRGKRRVLVDYDLMLESSSPQIQRVAQELNLVFDEDAKKRLKLFQEEFITQNLCHHAASVEELESEESVPDFVKEAYSWLLKLANDEIDFDDFELQNFWAGFEEECKSYDAGFRYVDKLISSTQKQTAELESAQRELESVKKQLLKATSERNNLQTQYQHVLHESANWQQQYDAVINSNSWRLMSVFRELRRYLITKPVCQLRKYLNYMLHAVWKWLPLSARGKARLKDQLYTKLPLLFKHTSGYRNWQPIDGVISNMSDNSSQLIERVRHNLYANENEPYVSLRDDAPGELPVRLLAFYLPQFHAIPENDEWWGDGFTEWTNVVPAEPQFDGHYQPHVPGELGYYNLTDPSVQKRQVELAKQFGVGGFCFYFYWFAGKRLLETPVLNYLNDTSLDFPFCLCWANENWSRRWDGMEDDVLIEQHHSAEDDLAFIEYISQYLRDPRSIRINGKPLLLVYRPSLLPSAKETAKRWRAWCRENGIGEIYLAYTQSFETVDPAVYDFDAAIEFPPNNSGPPVITEQMDGLSPDFSGTVYDWQALVKRSVNYQQSGYTLFRGVNPSWDNTARRKSGGTIFANSTPEWYQVWLSRAIEDTVINRDNLDERLVFINAWNEWAEGAYLEPDEKYGYAYLQATRNALEHVVKEQDKRRIVLVIHDAYIHGAQLLTLNMVKVLRESMGFIVDLIVLGNGPLIEEYRKYANVYKLGQYRVDGNEIVETIKKLRKQGATSAITNTIVTGLTVPVLKQYGFTVVSLVHELPQLIKNYQLQDNVKVIAEQADKVVFAASAVKDGFESFAELDAGKVVIRPQGLYKKNSLQTTQEINSARLELRKRLGIAEDAIIVLGVGFADYRKGVDIFVESGLEIISKRQNVYFLWLGDFETQIEREVSQKIESSGLSAHFIFPGQESDTDTYFAGADIYALTSREDPFPSVVLEALDARTPVVSFAQSGGSAELLSQGCGVLVDEMDSRSFASALIELIESPEKVKNLANEGKTIIDEEFSFRKYLFDLTDLAETGYKRVSAVIPNYNYGSYIKDRIRSVIEQGYPVYEVIILDDASTDNSVSVIKDMIHGQDIDCKLIINSDNSGNVFKQWAKGVALSTGDYVWIAEADDLSETGFLSEVIRPCDNENVVLSYCQSKQMDEHGEILCPNYREYVKDVSADKWHDYYINNGRSEIRDALAIKNTIPNVSGVVFKRQDIKEVLDRHIDEVKKYKVAGDWVTYIHVLDRGSIAYSPRELNLHRRHQSGLTISTFGLFQLEEIMSVQKTVRDLFSPSSDAIIKAKSYDDSLYEQFNLSTDEEPTIEYNQRLASYVDGAN